MNNIVYIAAAGSGKTTLLVKKACELDSQQNVLLLTYTDSNEKEIKEKFYKINGCIPANVCVQSWFSFLLQHFIKPYQNYLTYDNYDIKGLFVSQNTGNFQNGKWRPNKNNWSQYYFTKEHRALAEKLSELAYDCNEKSKGKPIDRLTNIFEHIYIDEVQDFAGYDLDLIKLLFLSKSNVILAGDPRQTTYLTNHNGNKNQKYRDGKIIDYLKEQKELKNKYTIDLETLNGSWRCCQEICEFASKISSDYTPTVSRTGCQNGLNGIFLVKPDDKIDFLKKYNNTMQLRWDKRTKNIDASYNYMNFGESKGLTFEAVLIYPTKDMKLWIENHSTELKSETKSKFYVAVTRAQFLVGVVWDKVSCSANDIDFWNKK